MKSPSYQIIPPNRIRNFFQNRKKDDTIENKRSAIFNPELKELVTKVVSPNINTVNSIVEKEIITKENGSSHPLESKLIEDENSSQEGIRGLRDHLVETSKREEFNTLFSLYSQENSNVEFSLMKYTSYLLERIGIQNFGWYFLSYDCQAYFCEMAKEIDSVTRTNFIFLKRDPFVQNPDSHFFELDITPQLALDPFFSKKFSLESLNLWSKIYFFFINEPGVDACLVAFIPRTDNLSDSGDGIVHEIQSPADRWIRMIQNKIVNLIPALAYHRDRMHASKSVNNDLLSHSIYLFKSFVGERSIVSYCHTIKIEKYRDMPNHYYLKRQFISNLMKSLNPREKLLELNIDTILLIGDTDHSDFILDQGDSDNLRLKIETKIYPAYGENILLYL
jgi:hypothetical protein